MGLDQTPNNIDDEWILLFLKQSLALLMYFPISIGLEFVRVIEFKEKLKILRKEYPHIFKKILNLERQLIL